MAFVIFLLYITLSFVRPYEFFPDLARFRLMLVVGSLGLFVTVLSVPLSRFSFRSLQLPFVAAFAVWAATSLIIALRWFGGAVRALNELGITLIVFILAVFSVNSMKRLRISLILLVGIALFLVFQDFMAIHFGLFREALVIEQKLDDGTTVPRARATGFMTDPNDLAQTLVCMIPFVALAWRGWSPAWNLFFVIIPTSIILYGVFLTGSRGAAVGLLVMLFVVVRPKLGNLLSGLGIVLGAVGLLAMSFGGRGFGMDASATGRLEAWSVGMQLLKQHPLTGVGYGMFTDFNPITAHNSFVLCFAELGLPGYFLWVAILLITFLELDAIRKLPVKTAEDMTLRRFARGIQVAFYSFLVSAWFLSRTYVVTLYLLVALGIAVTEIARRSGKQVGPISIITITTRTLIFMMASITLLYLQVRVQVR